MVNWERLGAFHSLATFRKKHGVSTGFKSFVTDFNTDQCKGAVFSYWLIVFATLYFRHELRKIWHI